METLEAFRLNAGVHLRMHRSLLEKLALRFSLRPTASCLQ